MKLIKTHKPSPDIQLNDASQTKAFNELLEENRKLKNIIQEHKKTETKNIEDIKGLENMIAEKDSQIDILKRRSVNLESIASAKEVEIENIY